MSAPKGKMTDDDAIIEAVDVGKIFGEFEALLHNVGLRVVPKGPVLGVPNHNGAEDSARRQRSLAWKNGG